MNITTTSLVVVVLQYILLASMCIVWCRTKRLGGHRLLAKEGGIPEAD